MPSNRAQGARSRHYGDPNYRNTSKDREPHKSSKPNAAKSGMLGAEMVSRLAELGMSINEFARVTGIGWRTALNYSHIDEPGKMPAWVDAVLRYAAIDPWFGRRFRPDGEHGYVRLRGSDHDTWCRFMDGLERLADALVRDDLDAAIQEVMRFSGLGWAFRNHLLEVKARAVAKEALEREDG